LLKGSPRRRSGRKSEARLVAVASGKANIVDVVTAVSETEAVEALSVRDWDQAYEIMRCRSEPSIPARKSGHPVGH
jgi:hypothetical protein